MNFVGRKKELNVLRRCYDSPRNQFIAVYGRRRVGKTALVEESFGDDFFFRHVAINPHVKEDRGEEDEERGAESKASRPLSLQLSTFANSFLLAGYRKRPSFSSWVDAFTELILLIKKAPANKRKVIFLDELPWMDTPRSNFRQSFEWFLNNVLPQNTNVCIIVAGSSTSWMLENVVENDTGIYRRITEKILLQPMSLYECELLLRNNRMELPRFQIAQAYMALGGIPEYLNQLLPELSLPKNIARICFRVEQDGKNEFEHLFSSMFDQSKRCEAICRFLAKRSKGYSREEICEGLHLSDGQSLSNALKALERGSFILRYIPYSGNKGEPMYKLIDPFCLFYLSRVEPSVAGEESLWVDTMINHEGSIWKGLAFENLCFCHLSQIKRALGIEGVLSLASRYPAANESDSRTQIDMVIERKDMVINLCEMKFTDSPFEVGAAYHESLMKRRKAFQAVARKDYTVQQVLISPCGIKRNAYSFDFTNTIDLDDLFMP